MARKSGNRFSKKITRFKLNRRDFYWQGKEPAAAFFTAGPFGLLPNEHIAWIDAGGGPRRCGTNSTRRALDAELQAIVTNACAAEASYALAEMERLNIEALAALTG